MFRKARAYYLVLSRLLMFRFRKRDHDDFWFWLYERVYDPDARDFENEILAHFLLLTALKHAEHHRAAKVFRDFEQLLASRLSLEQGKQLEYSLFVTEKWEGSEDMPLPFLKDV